VQCQFFQFFNDNLRLSSNRVIDNPIIRFNSLNNLKKLREYGKPHTLIHGDEEKLVTILQQITKKEYRRSIEKKSKKTKIKKSINSKVDRILLPFHCKEDRMIFQRMFIKQNSFQNIQNIENGRILNEEMMIKSKELNYQLGKNG
jgi:hypothetical protein